MNSPTHPLPLFTSEFKDSYKSFNWPLYALLNIRLPLVLMYGNPKASFWTNLQLCIKDKFILDIPFWIFTAFKSVIKFMKKGNEMAIYKVAKFLLVQTLHQTWFWLSKNRANTIINQSLEHVFIFKLVFFILNACYYL